MHIQFSSGYLKERDDSEDRGIDEKIILEWMFRKWGWGLWIGCMWLKIGIIGGLL
jgi:hypothetical protein